MFEVEVKEFYYVRASGTYYSELRMRHLHCIYVAD